MTKVFFFRCEVKFAARTSALKCLLSEKVQKPWNSFTHFHIVDIFIDIFKKKKYSRTMPSLRWIDKRICLWYKALEYVKTRDNPIKPLRFYEKTSIVIKTMYCCYWLSDTDTWARTWENVPFNKCAQRRLRSDCAHAQSDLSLRWAHIEAFYP